MDEELAPVSSPSAVKLFAENPTNLPLLDYQRHAPDWINWEIWEQRVTGSPFHGHQKKMCQSYSHSIGQALEGLGIALASCSLLEDELSAGQLAVITDTPLKTGKGYFLIWQQKDEKRTQIGDLIAHLTEQ